MKRRDLNSASDHRDLAEEEVWGTPQNQRLIEVRDILRGMQFVWPNERKGKAFDHAQSWD